MSYLTSYVLVKSDGASICKGEEVALKVINEISSSGSEFVKRLYRVEPNGSLSECKIELDHFKLKIKVLD